jgi:glucose-6-phosphate 1-epimerase
MNCTNHAISNHAMHSRNRNHNHHHDRNKVLNRSQKRSYCDRNHRTSSSSSSSSSVDRQGKELTVLSSNASSLYNEKFAIKNSVEFSHEGSDFCTLTHKNGSRAKIYLFGANCVSWIQPSGDDVLYVRPDAKFDCSKPIAGGIPICFPQFGMNGPLAQQHGFARNMLWEPIGTSADANPDDPEPSVMFSLKASEETRKVWDFDFECTYEVTLRRDKLKIEFCVRNNAEDLLKELEFTSALHTYIECVDASDSEKVFANGKLKNKKYMDKAVDNKNPPTNVYDRDTVTFGKKLVDSIFLNTEAEMLLSVGSGAKVSIENTSGWRDFVIWNPYDTLVPIDTWKSFACVESACAVTPVKIPGEGYVWKSEMNLQVV